MTDLIIISLESWNEVWRRNQHLVDGLLAADTDLRVVFVEPPADPAHDLASRRAPTWGHGPRRVRGQQRLVTYRPTKWLPRRLDAGVDRRLANGIIRMAGRVGFQRPLLWINDPAASQLSRLSGWPTLYDITDDWLAADRPAAELARLASDEEALLASADEVVACSAELVRRKSPQRVGAPIRLIPNAVDAAAYRRPTQRPADLPEGRVALYVGTLHADRLDVALTAESAEALGAAGTLVLVGPDLLSAHDSRRLRDAGAVILGSRSRNDVIAYLQHADVLVVPHLVNVFTESLDPIKLYEYQAVGHRVVSTPVAGFRDAGGPVLVTARQTFAHDLRDSLDNAVATRSWPSVPDWSDRVHSMAEVLSGLGRRASIGVQGARDDSAGKWSSDRG